MNNPDDIRFMVDHMLVKLGKYLRILGFDADWDGNIRTHELITRANRERRLFITRNTRLPYQYPLPDHVMLIHETDPAQQFTTVVARLKLETARYLFSKCIRCNVLLQPVADKEEIRSLVHPNVFGSYNTFYRCPSCKTVFWKGSHVRNTCRKLRIEPPAESKDLKFS